MFTIKPRHSSVANLLKVPNPQMSSKASSRKQAFFDKESLRESELQSRISNVLPKINKNPKVDTATEFFQMKKKQKSHTVCFYQYQKQLALTINKYQMRRGQHGSRNSSELSFDIMNVLRCFAKVENNFQDLFMNLVEDIKVFIYLSNNVELVEKYEVKQGELYKNLVDNIDATANKKLKQAYEKVRQANDARQQIEVQFQRYKVLWEQKQKKYKDQIEYLKKLTNNQYIKYLEQKLNEQTQRIEQLETSQKSLVLLRDQYEKTIQKQQASLSENLNQISCLNTVIYDLRISKQQSQKMILKLRDRFDQFNLKMTGIKDMISDVQQQNEQLKTQRMSLIKRAAVSFEELTPRPKYKKMMNFTQKQQLLALKPTIQITEVMFRKIGNDAFLEDFRQQMFDMKLSNKKQLHPKLQQAQKIRSETQRSITDSKIDLKQVQKLFEKQSW